MAQLCETCVEFLSVAGAGITVMTGCQTGPVSVSDPRIGALEDVQYSVGQGPCRDAFATGLWVHALRLDDGAASKWPSFVALALSSEIGAVFSYPLVSSGAKIGAMTLYNAAPGDLTPARHKDTIDIAEVITEALLSLQDEALSGTLAEAFEESVVYRAEIYQAAGMTAVQLSISSADALLRIQAHSFASGETVLETAAHIVARRLQLPDDQPEIER